MTSNNHIETNPLICIVNQQTGFYIKDGGLITFSEILQRRIQFFFQYKLFPSVWVLQFKEFPATLPKSKFYRQTFMV